MDLKIGKLGSANIANVPIVDGQVIFSEHHNAQFVDYDSKRHTFSHIITGVFNESTYVDFSETDVATALEAIKTNGEIVDGQKIKIAKSIYEYRKINDKHILVTDGDKMSASANEPLYMIYLPKFAEEDKVAMQILVAVTVEDACKVYLLDVVDNALSMDTTLDMDGQLESSLFTLSIAQEGGLFTISSSKDATLQILSINVTSTGDDTTEFIKVVTSA